MERQTFSLAKQNWSENKLERLGEGGLLRSMTAYRLPVSVLLTDL